MSEVTAWTLFQPFAPIFVSVFSFIKTFPSLSSEVSTCVPAARARNTFLYAVLISSRAGCSCPVQLDGRVWKWHSFGTFHGDKCAHHSIQHPQLRGPSANPKILSPSSWKPNHRKSSDLGSWGFVGVQAMRIQLGEKQ